jgi:hypothetical protein
MIPSSGWLWFAKTLRRSHDGKPFAKLNAFPPGLDSLYRGMMEQIWNSDNADLCKRILAPAIIVHWPITMKELTLLVEIGPRPTPVTANLFSSPDASS